MSHLYSTVLKKKVSINNEKLTNTFHLSRFTVQKMSSALVLFLLAKMKRKINSWGNERQLAASNTLNRDIFIHECLKDINLAPECFNGFLRKSSLLYKGKLKHFISNMNFGINPFEPVSKNRTSFSSQDPNQIPHNQASDQHLYCLEKNTSLWLEMDFSNW